MIEGGGPQQIGGGEDDFGEPKGIPSGTPDDRQTEESKSSGVHVGRPAKHSQIDVPDVRSPSELIPGLAFKTNEIKISDNLDAYVDEQLQRAINRDNFAREITQITEPYYALFAAKVPTRQEDAESGRLTIKEKLGSRQPFTDFRRGHIYTDPETNTSYSYSVVYERLRQAENRIKRAHVFVEKAHDHSQQPITLTFSFGQNGTVTGLGLAWRDMNQGLSLSVMSDGNEPFRKALSEVQRGGDFEPGESLNHVNGGRIDIGFPDSMNFTSFYTQSKPVVAHYAYDGGRDAHVLDKTKGGTRFKAERSKSDVVAIVQGMMRLVPTDEVA